MAKVLLAMDTELARWQCGDYVGMGFASDVMSGPRLAESDRCKTGLINHSEEAVMDKPGFHRRTLLKGVIAAACASCVTRLWAARDATMVSKEQAQYQDAPNGDQQCSNCTHFIAESNTCRLVEGKVSPDGYCILWAGSAKTHPDSLGLQ